MDEMIAVGTEGTEEQFQDAVASAVVNAYVQAQQDRQGFLERGAEARAYITSTTTATTEVGKLPWKNKTCIPKLTQIADNLKAYYMAALFPADDWFVWEGSNLASMIKAKVIEEYMRTKLRVSGFREELKRCVDDWVVYGNCFAGVTWVEKYLTDPISGESIPGYIGPRMYRISPTAALMNAKATSFEKSAFLKRELVHISELGKSNVENKDVLKKIKEHRNLVTYDDVVDLYADAGLRIDGFETTQSYLASGMVELIEYWGDIFVDQTGETKKNMHVVVVDRRLCLVLRKNPSITGRKPFAHNGWRQMQDNLYGQAPIDQLVGMQYRCDHLENLKADAFDQIIHPMMKIKGDTVEDFKFGPGGKIYCGSEGDVEFLRPDASVLQCNNEISYYQNMMEQMAGSPKESMGFRTPGEKTAFEVDVLQRGADRMFLDKVNQFEAFIESILNTMFELIIMNMNFTDVIKTFNDETKQETFRTITRADVAAVGTLKPTGAKHYAARNKRVQELQQFAQMLQLDPGIKAHVSSLNIAKMLEEELGYDKYNLVEEFIGVKEQVSVQMQAQMYQKLAQQAMGGDPNGEGQQGGMPPNGAQPGAEGSIPEGI